ncbi:MAG: hypothetical protein SCARUB_02094 [Candidatus Scalindua rubra]|uniref:Plasmid stabilization system protein n=1 Tax=Candidatus Scalindua rubra TaxID=1872076 RepID=A0A1E3XCT1_9BACT|nr:MAG: hypothetical protein SCARUB_02094 [Candidatus Scalindua rubra]
MKTEYLPSFIKDLKTLKGSPYYEKIKTLAFDDIPKLSDIDEVKNLKKLKGNKPFYRVRVGDYRIGFRLDYNILACPVKCRAYLTGGQANNK